jgi:hypothetical protein
MNELKSCPFCGSRATLHERTDGFYVDCAMKRGFCSVMPSTWVYKTEEEAINAWNRRVDND